MSSTPLWPYFLKWLDVVDVLVLSFLIQRLVLLFRGTTTLHVTAALLVLMIIYAVAHESNLILTSRFLEGLAAVSVLVIVVAFRDEIRDVLIQSSPARLILGRPPSKPEDAKIHAAVEAAFRMAEKRIGALLVFQSRDRLGAIVRDGVALGGQISVPILESLFSKESPVHDGAALIRSNKIERVGTFLPLTQRRDLPSEFGTRHRAAIGLCELSDAVVVVVSEERGEVSFVHRGVVQVVETRQELEALLGDQLGWNEVGRRSKGWRGEIRRQLIGFVLTFLAVSVYWGIYYGRQVSVMGLSARLDFRDLPDHLALEWVSAEQVDLQIQGPRPLIEDLKPHPEQITVSLSLKGMSPGENQVVRLGSENVGLPVGLEVARITPSTITLDLAQRVQRSIPVSPTFSGPLPDGVRVLVKPERIVLIGSESALKELEEVKTRRIPIQGVRQDQLPKTLRVELAPLPPSVRAAENQPQEVQVTFQPLAVGSQPGSTPAGSKPTPDGP